MPDPDRRLLFDDRVERRRRRVALHPRQTQSLADFDDNWLLLAREDNDRVAVGCRSANWLAVLPNSILERRKRWLAELNADRPVVVRRRSPASLGKNGRRGAARKQRKKEIVIGIEGHQICEQR
jgi:hypothetical protein